MDKKAERLNVLTENNNGKNFVHAILNAVTKGYSDNVVIDDVIDLVRQKEISKGILATAPEALRTYAKSIENSLIVIADEIEGIEIQESQEQIIRRKKFENKVKENIVEEEMEKIEENEEDQDEEGQEQNKEETQEEEKTTKTASKNEIKITEDFEQISHNEKENKLAGTLFIDFNQNMGIYKKGTSIVLGKSASDYVRNKIYGYFRNEYPQLKAQLTSKIFIGNIIFDNIKTGKATLNYEIKDAF